MNIRKYLDNKMPRKYSDLTKYLSSYSIATLASLATKSLSSWILDYLKYGDLVIAIGSSVLCTAAFLVVKWPLYRWLHENRYAQGDSVSRDRTVELTTTVISSLVTNVVSIIMHYALLRYFRQYPALTGFASQFTGGAAGAFAKIILDKILGLVIPSGRKQKIQ